MPKKLFIGPSAPIQSINLNWYFKTYNQIIDKFRKYPKILFETANHHIYPRSLGGNDANSNLVNLPHRYHLVAHLLLAKIYGGLMIHAAWRMSNSNGMKINNRIYDFLRQEHAKLISVVGKNRIYTDEDNRKNSESKKGIRKTKTDKWLKCQTRFKLGSLPWNTGTKLSYSHVESIKNVHTNIKI
jgi:hypothetical protein